MAGSAAAATPERTEFVTTDIDAAHGWLRDNYNEYHPTQSEAPRGTRFRGTRNDFGSLTTSRLQFPMSAEILLPQIEILLVARVAEGWYGYRDGSEWVKAHARETMLVPRKEDVHFAWSRLDVGTITVDPHDVERIACETTGIDPAALDFAGGPPVSADAEHYWHAAVAHVNRSVLPNPLAASSGLVQAESARMLAVAMLATFENTAMGFEPAKGGLGATPAAVRRAVRFIDDNAHIDITLTEIAAAASIGPRALQHAFRRHLEMTPMAYLRRVRLAGAHRDLVSADPFGGASIAEIAARWGFAHPGRFATTYREAYGRRPREALYA